MFIIFVSDGAAGGTLARVLAARGALGFSVGTTTKRSSLTRSVTPNHLGLSSLTLSSVGGAAGASQVQLVNFSSKWRFF